MLERQASQGRGLRRARPGFRRYMPGPFETPAPPLGQPSPRGLGQGEEARSQGPEFQPSSWHGQDEPLAVLERTSGSISREPSTPQRAPPAPGQGSRKRLPAFRTRVMAGFTIHHARMSRDYHALGRKSTGRHLRNVCQYSERSVVVGADRVPPQRVARTDETSLGLGRAVLVEPRELGLRLSGMRLPARNSGFAYAECPASPFGEAGHSIGPCQPRTSAITLSSSPASSAGAASTAAGAISALGAAEKRAATAWSAGCSAIALARKKTASWRL